MAPHPLVSSSNDRGMADRGAAQTPMGEQPGFRCDEYKFDDRAKWLIQRPRMGLCWGCVNTLAFPPEATGE